MWRRLNPARRRWRWPLKVCVALAMTTLVLFPRVDLLVRNIGHWSRLDALIEPEAPGLAALEGRVRERLAARGVGKGSEAGGEPSLPLRGLEETGGPLLPLRALKELPSAEVLAVTQRVVEEAIPYAWDWDTWGVADYVPTVGETLGKGREDCDGRAVVAASLLRRMGYDARLMSDLGHVWVWTPLGETMNPSELAGGEVFVQQTERGSRLNWLAVFNWRAAAIDWPRNVTYGVAVFPAWRECVLLLTAWALLLGRRVRWGPAATGLIVSGAGLWVMRRWCADFWNPTIGAAWLGLVLAAGGLVWTVAMGTRRERVEREGASLTTSPA